MNAKGRWMWFITVCWGLSIVFTIVFSIVRNMIAENPKNDTEAIEPN